MLNLFWSDPVTVLDIRSDTLQRLQQRAIAGNCSVDDLLNQLLDGSAGIFAFPYADILKNTTDIIALFDLEHAEVPQLDAALGDQRFDDRVKSPLDDFLGLELGEVGSFRDLFDNFFLGHASHLLRMKHGMSGEGIERFKCKNRLG